MPTTEQIRTLDELNTALAEMRSQLAALDERGEEKTSAVERMIEDLRVKVRELDEANIEARRTSADGPESALRAYIETDEETIRRAGYHDRQTIAHVRSGDAPRPLYAHPERQEAVRMTAMRHSDGGIEYGLLDDPEPVCAWQEELQRLVDQRAFVRLHGVRRTPICDRRIRAHLARAPEALHRIFADVADAGAEWIIDTSLPMLERELQLARRVESLFDTFTIPPGGSLIVPFLDVGLRPYKASAVTADDPARFTASSLDTAQRTVTAAKLAVRTQVDRDAQEDAILAVESVLRAELIAALVDGSEDAIVNGDTASTHQDAIASWNIRNRWGSSGLGGSGDHRRLWIGLRARAKDVSNEADGSAAETFSGLMSDVASLDSPHGLGRIVMLVSPEYYLAKVLLWTEVVTVDKLGPQATILTGALGKAGPAQIVLSEFIDKELNTAGVYDNVTKTKTGYLVFNADRFKMGVRAGARVERDVDITRDVVDHVAIERKVFHTFDSSTKKNVRWSYNHSIS